MRDAGRVCNTCGIRDDGGRYIFWDIVCRKGYKARKVDDAGPLGDVYFRAAPLASRVIVAWFFETALPDSLPSSSTPTMAVGHFNINEAETSVRYLSMQRARARVYANDKKPEGGDGARGENLKRQPRCDSFVIF